MVLASDAEVLFLDEPTTGLDPIARREVWQAVRRTIRENRTILLTTHYLDEAEALSSRLALIEKGCLRLEGTPEDLRARVRYPYRVTVQEPFPRDELDPYGRVADIEGGHLVFARESGSAGAGAQGPRARGPGLDGAGQPRGHLPRGRRELDRGGRPARVESADGMTERHRLRSLVTFVQLNGIIPIRTQPALPPEPPRVAALVPLLHLHRLARGAARSTV